MLEAFMFGPGGALAGWRRHVGPNTFVNLPLDSCRCRVVVADGAP
jgi:hypothetical protein